MAKRVMDAATAAKRKAQQALDALRDPAVDTWRKLLEQFNAQSCPTCGYPMRNLEEKKFATDLVRKILDRTGMGPSATLFVPQSEGDFDLRALTGAERDEIVALLGQLREVKARVRRRQFTHDESGLTGGQDVLH